MEYKEIVAVTGLGGLFQLLTTKSDGAIVRSIADKTTRFISARQHNVTPLESIEVYTTSDNVRLQDVFKKMQEAQATVGPVDPKVADNNAIKSYFKTILPEFDEDRVYVSDMKKMLKWFELLNNNGLLRFETPSEETVVEPVANPDKETPKSQEAVVEATPKPAKAPRKKASTAAETPAGEDAPVKKTARKKKVEE